MLNEALEKPGPTLFRSYRKSIFLKWASNTGHIFPQTWLLINFMTDWAAIVAEILELFYSVVNMSPLFPEV